MYGEERERFEAAYRKSLPGTISYQAEKRHSLYRGCGAFPFDKIQQASLWGDLNRHNRCSHARYFRGMAVFVPIFTGSRHAATLPFPALGILEQDNIQDLGGKIWKERIVIYT